MGWYAFHLPGPKPHPSVLCGHETFQEYFPFSWYEAQPSHQTMMAMNVIGTSLWVAIAYYCYQVKFFVKI